ALATLTKLTQARRVLVVLSSTDELNWVSLSRGGDDGVVLRGLIAALAPDRREAFVATQVLGLSYAEAAEVCGCPVGTIRSRVARAREDLAAAWSGDVRDRRAR
ncbi:sigma factor-like helix-turn-helix DNA-binding protein, partial [Micromonospora chalcea]|uniref:sigma factor-like helix-turn-helix DNA-binding protein n=1 Tax=Micromonospora chalcea TaxID=1874 RepID=UPI0033F40D6C